MMALLYATAMAASLFLSTSSTIFVSSISLGENAAQYGATPISAFNASPSIGRTRSARARASSLNLALQEKILGGLGMKWGNGEVRNTNVNVDDNQMFPQPSGEPQIPFIIQKIGRGTKIEIEEISRMCVDVFFNAQTKVNTNGDGKKQTPPWMAMQLAYLRNLQEGDILARNAFNKDLNIDLIVARRVYPVTDATTINGTAKDLLSDESQIHNLENNWSGGRGYLVGEIIGYSEVSEKNFGLGGNFDSGRQRTSKSERLRPYLSNLSVVEYARRSGVGSCLLDACEECVRSWNVPDHAEIVLQVEEDNPTAIQFYKRRGWEFVFADPTCRRYDTSGFFLKESRVTKYAMVKRLDAASDGRNDSEGNPGYDSESLIQKLKNSFFVQ